MDSTGVPDMACGTVRCTPASVKNSEMPSVGDWYCSTTVSLRLYDERPSRTLYHPCAGMSACALQPLKRRLQPRTYVGPVHETDFTHAFVSVLVPHPEDSTRLPWTNIWKRRRHRGGLQIASRVHTEVVDRWFRAGWRNRYIARSGRILVHLRVRLKDSTGPES